MGIVIDDDLMHAARMRLTLGARGIAPNYGVEEFMQDVAVVRGAAPA